MPTTEYVISSRQQLAALSSPMRQEILDVLSQMGTVSVTELAAALNRPADALYYHIRALKKVGLVVREGLRMQGKRKEELIRTVAPDLKLQYVFGKGGNLENIGAIVSAMLRLGIRDFDNALGSGNVVVDGPQRDLWAFRKTGWLAAKDVERLNTIIAKLQNGISKPHGNGRLYALSLLLTPLERPGERPSKDEGE